MLTFCFDAFSFFLTEKQQLFAKKDTKIAGARLALILLLKSNIFCRMEVKAFAFFAAAY